MRYTLVIDWEGTGLWIGASDERTGALHKSYWHNEGPQTPGEWFEELIRDDQERSAQRWRDERSLQLALDIIADLLRSGEHEGPCDNDEGYDGACELHLAAYKRRKERAIAFLAEKEVSPSAEPA